MEKIQVGYSVKKSTDDYGSVGISGLVEFVPESENLQEEYDSMFVYLKTVIDQKLDIVAPEKEDQPQAIAQTGHIPPKPTPSPVAESDGLPDVPERTPEPEGQTQAGSQESKGDTSTPSGVTKEEIFLGKAKVFRFSKKKDRNNKNFVDMRIGHEDLTAHLGEQYITVKTWDPDAIEAVSALRDRTKVKDGISKEDSKIVVDTFVDVWGTFNPWQSDPSVYDLNATALRLSPAQ